MKMNILKTIAIDDEPLALSLIKEYILKTPYLELAGTFDNPADAGNFLSNNKADLMFLDIQMPDLSGIDFIKTLPIPPKVIIATAFEKYALETFKINAVDYLLKPFDYAEFLAAVNKARKMLDLESNALVKIDADQQFLFLKSEYRIKKISFHEILYLEGMKDYIKVYLETTDKPVVSINTLKALEEKLPSTQFMRVHRSYIVNLQKIDTIERRRIVFGDKHIPVSEPYLESFRGFIQKNFL